MLFTWIITTSSASGYLASYILQSVCAAIALHSTWTFPYLTFLRSLYQDKCVYQKLPVGKSSYLWVLLVKGFVVPNSKSRLQIQQCSLACVKGQVDNTYMQLGWSGTSFQIYLTAVWLQAAVSFPQLQNSGKIAAHTRRLAVSVRV